MGDNSDNREVYQLQYGSRHTGFHQFYIFPLLYVLSIYSAMISHTVGALVSTPLYVPLLFGVVNVIVSVTYCKPENRKILFNTVVLMKYALIPFYIIGGMAIIGSFLFSLVPIPGMIFVGPAVAILGSILGWLLLALQAPYTIAYLRLTFRENIFNGVLGIVHGILQFIFVLDVIDVMVMTFLEKRWRKLTIAVILLLAVAAWGAIVFIERYA